MPAPRPRGQADRVARDRPADLPPCRWGLPDPLDAPPGQELLAVGADLDPSTLVAAYRSGLFPMPLAGPGRIGWWSPDPRGVLPPDGFHASRSLRRSARHLRTTVDTAFEQVVAGCADPGRPHGWITPAIAAAYQELHRLGWAHSVEVWNGDRLVGGLYGVEVGGLFAAESMFHRATDASKVALWALVTLLSRDARPGRLIDVQWLTPHLASLGAVEVPRTRYVRMLQAAAQLDPVLSR